MWNYRHVVESQLLFVLKGCTNNSWTFNVSLSVEMPLKWLDTSRVKTAETFPHAVTYSAKKVPGCGSSWSCNSWSGNSFTDPIFVSTDIQKSSWCSTGVGMITSEWMDTVNRVIVHHSSTRVTLWERRCSIQTFIGILKVGNLYMTVEKISG